MIMSQITVVGPKKKKKVHMSKKAKGSAQIFDEVYNLYKPGSKQLIMAMMSYPPS